MDYMTTKKAKLSEQFLEEHKMLKELPPQIFSGIRIYVNGYTVPPAEELKNLVVKHGGVYSTFLDSGVTHMVANNLPDNKVKSLNKIKVVRPEWILDSVKQEKILSCSEYFTYNPMKDHQRMWNINEVKGMHSSSSGQTSKCSPVMVLGDPSDKSSERTSMTPKNGPLVGADINSYYSRSRLHFLSTMKMELRTYIRNLKSEKKFSFPGLEKLRNWVKEKCHASSSVDCHWQLSDVGEPTMRFVIHIDMDCFFASVSRVGRPNLEGVPVVVTSSKISSYGTGYNEIKDSMADIACCSYEARDAGVRNGMWMGKALQICPKLVAVPYEFEKYRSVSKKMYEIVTSYTLDLEAVSCDELYIDCTSAIMETKCSPLDFAEYIRQEIKEETGCSASAGIGANRIQARLATRKAKPNGVFYLRPENVETFMKDVQLEDLPGVGPILSRRLKELNLFTCGQLCAWDLSKLEKEFGPATGRSLYRHSQGLESLSKEAHNTAERKSVSSEINYGIRFTQFREAEETIVNLSKILSSKLNSLEGKCITLKLKVRSSDAPVTSAKFLGHGICDNYCRTSTINIPTSDPEVISKVAIELLKKSNILISDIRGVGVMMNKLEESGTKQKRENIEQFFKQPQDLKKHYCKVKTKNVVMSVEDKLNKNGVTAKVSDFGPSTAGSSFIGNLAGEMDLIKSIDDYFKSYIEAGNHPDKIFKNKILYMLLNEVAYLNISSVTSSLRELTRLLKINIINPETRKMWSSLFEEIRAVVHEEVSKVVGYPISNFSCLCD